MRVAAWSEKPRAALSQVVTRVAGEDWNTVIKTANDETVLPWS